ncbi:MAG: oxygen-independent coproporphyrinogen III oxidase [Nitrosomonas sp.]|nr:oxygen-independent coproporphyrinogen III oxidase [Nitrosomonas sp.]MDP1949589.1 oxygen-independent coproporphyrinogen III oxidase [Nitrosomonas sp.]
MRDAPEFSQSSIGKLKVDLDIIRRFDFDTQHYSLYPKINRFIEAFNAPTYINWVNNRKIGGARRPLSIYVHFPFCSSLCFHCSYNHIVSNSKTNIKQYLGFLLREIKLQGELFRDDSLVEQVHFGGGTPTLLSDNQLRSVMSEIKQNFNLIKDGDYSVEIDPRQVTNKSIVALKKMGFNCAILGVQDFDHEVQQAIHRFQNEEDTLRVIQAAQYEGFRSINIELVYGLPKQSVEKFDRTLKKIINVRPTQISLLSYVHLPVEFKPQRQIKNDDLPLTEVKLEIVQHAVDRLSNAGYVHLGINHFARSDDKLVVAQQQGRLYHHLHGYSTHMDSDLIGLGVSAIGSIGPTYSQNYCDLRLYYDRLEQNVLPIMRGLELTNDDLVRRLVMHMLICNSILSFESIETVFPIDFKHYFAIELANLLEYQKLDLLTLDDDEITITPKGRLLICSICMVFDKYQRARNKRERHFKII